MLARGQAESQRAGSGRQEAQRCTGVGIWGGVGQDCGRVLLQGGSNSHIRQGAPRTALAAVQISQQSLWTTQQEDRSTANSVLWPGEGCAREVALWCSGPQTIDQLKIQSALRSGCGGPCRSGCAPADSAPTHKPLGASPEPAALTNAMNRWLCAGAERWASFRHFPQRQLSVRRSLTPGFCPSPGCHA